MKKLALVAALLVLSGCGTHMQPAAMVAPGALEAQAAKVPQADQDRAEKIIEADFIQHNFEKDPNGKGFIIRNPNDPDDYVVMKKVSSGFKKFKFTPGPGGVLAWTADQECVDSDYQTFTTHVSGTVDLKTKKVTYKF
jgi:hypothetical protein